MQVSTIKSFIDEYNWKGINHPISRNDFSRLEKKKKKKNALGVIYVDRDVRTIKDVEEYIVIHKSIRQEYLSKHYFEREKKKFCDDISIKQELAKGISKYARLVKNVKTCMRNVKIVKNAKI